jgi:hypothetical protein
LKNAKFIFLSIVILLGIPTTIVVAVAFSTPISLGPGYYREPMEEISIDWGSYDTKENAIFVNCTLTKGYNGATECNLTTFTLGYTTKIQNYRGSVCEGIPVPSKLLLNETTTVRLNLATPLPPEIYSVNLRTNYGGSSYTLNVGNFTDPQEQIEIKEISYNRTTNTLFVECTRIYDRTDLFLVVKDNRSAGVSLDNFDRPVRIAITPNTTELRINPQEPLVPGKYCLYLVTPKGLITPFTVP